MWLVAFPAARRLRWTHQPPDGEAVEYDTRIVCVDFEGVARTVRRIEATGLPAQLVISRRGVPYAVLPGKHLRYLAQEEPDTWSLAVASASYLCTLHRESLERLSWAWGSVEPAEAVPPPPTPPRPSADYEAYEA